jgi:hypothetical protein
MQRAERSLLLFAIIALAACGAPSGGGSASPVPPGFPAGTTALPATQDAAVWAGLERNSPHGDGTSIQVKTYEDSDDWGWAFRRAFLKFPLEDAPVYDDTSVHLALFGNLKDGVLPVTTQVYGINDEDDRWQEDSLTWDSQPQRRESVPLGELGFEHELADITRFEEFGSWHFSSDIASEERDELDGNGTLTLRLENETVNEVLFFTREHAEGWDLSPRLVFVAAATSD